MTHDTTPLQRTTPRHHNVSIIAAVAANGAIGHHNQLLWHLPEDLQRFKRLTTNHTVIMGRKTFKSLPTGPLPHRVNVVISRNATAIDGCEVYDSLEKAIEAHRTEEEIFVIGGAQVYADAINMASRLYLTHVECSPDKADAFFPPIVPDEWQTIKKEKHQGFSFVDYRFRQLP